MKKIKIIQLIEIETKKTLGFFNNLSEIEKYMKKNQQKGWLRMNNLEYWI